MTDDDIDDIEDLDLEPATEDATDELSELEPVDDAESGDLELAAAAAVGTALLADDDAPAPAPAAAPAAEATSVADPAAADPAAGGQWVWQYAAPPPPPSFGAAFFSGTAVKDLYRRFAAALVVVIGCLLPWGPVMETVPNTAEAIADGAAATIEQMAPMAGVAGVETLAGALTLLLGLWLMYASLHGIYTSQQKILPVFLMIEPAIVSWMLTLDAWAGVESEGFLERLNELGQRAGTGVLLTLVGSTYVAGAFLLLFAKVFVKKDPESKSAKRAARSSKSDDDEAKSEKKGKGDKKDKKGGKRRR